MARFVLPPSPHRSSPRACSAKALLLFSDTVAGANASANLYQLMQTCKVNRINLYSYLQALLVALPLARTADSYEVLLPWNIVLPPG